MDKMTELKKLHEIWLLKNTCQLKSTATQGVVGDGSADAEIVFIGEAPGAQEDKHGKPFIGAAGKFLNEMLESIHMNREDIYITNLVKYRPPENRDPTKEEIEACHTWLLDEIRTIDPLLIVTLGRHAMNYFFPEKKITNAHGEIFSTHIFNKPHFVLPLYHPAAALYNGSLREVLKSDFKRIPTILKHLEDQSQCEPII